MGKLDDRVAIVTGAGRGIGAAIAKMMAAEGAKVVVNDLGTNVDGSGVDTGPADETVAAIRDAGGHAVANHDSVADYNAAERIIQQALDEYGTLDVLINVAGILRDRMVFNMTEEEWDAVIDVHMKGTFNTSKYAAIYWRSQREGHYRLINFSSGSGLYGAPGQPNYAAAKLGIVGFTYSCANALSRYGVTSNAIAPGAATRMGDTIPSERRRGFGGGDRDPREGDPENVAPAVCYLASTQSDWINGRVIGASGFQISLYSNPEVIARAVNSGPWDLDQAFNAIERTFREPIEGRRLFSPPPTDS